MDKNKEIVIKQPVNQLTTSIVNALETANKLSLSTALRVYKNPNGSVNYWEVMRVPLNDRLPGLIENIGLEKVHRLMGAAITLAMEAMNLKTSFTAGQIFELVDTIIDSSTEDYLALEDVVLFLQKLVRGEAGKLFNSIDIPTFMSLFEKYRQDRHSELMRFRDEQYVQNKVSGKSDGRIIVTDRDIDATTMLELMQTYHESREGLSE